jgi:hypothetical protein
MVVMSLAVVACIPACGGSWRQLSSIPLRWGGAAALSLLAQLVVLSLLPGGHPLVHATVHVASYLPLLAFFVINRRIWAMPVIALGTVANLVVICANGGVMPASAAAFRAAGMAATTHGFANSTPVAHARLAWLGDIFATPARIPLHNVFSVGDVLITLGAALVILHASGAIGRRRAGDATAWGQRGDGLAVGP